MGALISFGIFLVFLIIAFITGKMIAGAHLRRLDEAEAEDADMPVDNLRHLKGVSCAEPGGAMVMGSAVLGVDYFRTWISGLKLLIGGRLGMVEAVLDRARRQALARMRDKAKDGGYDTVVNVRIETSQVVGGKGAMTVEVLAYGTAYKRPR
jgi:uncharacterized protein YbjQ (UPF0145 family)